MMSVLDKEAFLEILNERRLDVLSDIERTSEKIKEFHDELWEVDHAIAEIELELERK